MVTKEEFSFYDISLGAKGFFSCTLIITIFPSDALEERENQPKPEMFLITTGAKFTCAVIYASGYGEKRM